MTSTVAVVVFVVGLVGSIMVHEWGHFATARRFGMRADRFFLGFGPTVFSTRRGETEYGVKALPLGGFVSIRGMGDGDERRPPLGQAMASRGDDPRSAFGDVLDERGAPPAVRERLMERFDRNLKDDASSEQVCVLATELVASEVPDTGRRGDLRHRLLRGDEGRFFHDRPRWERAVVLASGSALHMVQAALLLFVGFLLFGQTVVEPVVAQFAALEQDEPTPAELAGLAVGDRILAVDGMASDDFAEIRDLLRARPGEPVQVTYERDGEQTTTTATPAAAVDEATGEEVGQLGFVPSTRTESLAPDLALYRTFVGPGSLPAMLVGTLDGLVRVFGPEGVTSLVRQIGDGGATERSPDGGISIVGAAGAAGQVTSLFGPLSLFVLLANVNVFIGVFNILPLPPLDGGHLAVLGVEAGVNAARGARGEPRDFRVDPRTIATVALPVILLVATVSIGLLYLDITQPLQLQ